MNVKIILAFISLSVLSSCEIETEKTHNSKLLIQYNIQNLTSIDLDTTKFEVLTDSVHHTEGAFDSDYTWYVNIQFEEEYFEKIKKTIRTSKNFKPNSSYYDINWSNIDTSLIKGVWYSDSSKLGFVQKPLINNSEPFDLFIDTTTLNLKLELMHF